MMILMLCVFSAALFLNGATDASNAVTGAISSKALPPLAATLAAAVFECIGLVLSCLFFPSVGNTVSSLTDLAGTTSQDGAIVCAVCLGTVALWAALAWAAGLPTSESHGLMAAMCGCGAALGSKLDPHAVGAVLLGLVLSVVCSAALSHAATWLMKPMKDKNTVLRRMCIGFLSSSAFLHGAQDGQKFLALLSAAGIMSKSPMAVVICAALMSAGTLCGGGRIVKKMGDDMIRSKLYTSCAADVGSSMTLLILTAAGIPVSTTHTKMSALAAASRKNGEINKKVLLSLGAAWITTLPFCYFVSFLLMKFIISWHFC